MPLQSIGSLFYGVFNLKGVISKSIYQISVVLKLFTKGVFWNLIPKSPPASFVLPTVKLTATTPPTITSAIPPFPAYPPAGDSSPTTPPAMNPSPVKPAAEPTHR